ncbi:MAG: hypothetical protein RR301_05030 [Clostridia bacterium]
MSEASHRLIMLKPMQTAVSGYARVQTGGGQTLLQINLRGLRVPAVRAFLYCGYGEVKELGHAPVNPRGEAALMAEAPLGRVAPERLQALLISGDGDEPIPLLIGLFVQQSAGSLLDAKNALLALCEKLSRASAARREQERAQQEQAKAAKAAELEAAQREAIQREAAAQREAIQREAAQREAAHQEAAASPPSSTPAVPPTSALIAPPARSPTPAHSRAEPEPSREIFLPAIDPAPYIAAGEAKEPPPGNATLPDQSSFPSPFGAENLTPPSRHTPSVGRLPTMAWPPAYRRLQEAFARYPPCALFDLPGWRFVQVSAERGGLWMGYAQQDARVTRIAYALLGERPPDDGTPYRPRRGLDGRMYQVLWQKV